MLSKRTLVSLTLAALCSAQAIAQSDDDMMGEMSLEDLLNLEVSVASTKSETITSTPAVVSRYSSADLQLMGMRSLSEFLSFVPGMLVDENNFGIPGVMARGTGSDFGAKVLVLLDGMPYWSSTHGQTPINGMTFETIDRIEVIRGPGAVIYGSNAISGVINVITRKDDGGSVNTSFGSGELLNTSGYYSTELEFGARLSMGFEVQSYGGYSATFVNPTATDGPTSVPTTLDRSTEKRSALVRLAGDNYNIGLHMFEDETDGIIVNSSLPLGLQSEGYQLSGDYRFDFGEANYVKVYGMANHYRPAFDLTSNRTFYRDDGKANMRYLAGAQLNYAVTDDLALLAGIEVEERKTDTYFARPEFLDRQTTIGTKDSTQEDSAYLQLDYSLGDFRFLVGGRYIDNEKAGDDINPRASVVYNISEEQSLKLLYSVGFTSPSFIQTTIELPGVVRGNPNLTAETITTYDLAYTYASGGTLFVANLYYYEGEEFITRFIPVNDNTATFRNGEKFDRTGMELDYQTKFDDWTVFANFAYNDEGDEVLADDPRAILVPQYTGNVGASYRYKQHSFGSTIKHVSDRGIVDAYTDVKLNYSYFGEGYEAFVTVRNLIGDDLFAPDVGGGSGYLIPNGDEDANIRAGVRLTF